MSTTLKLGGVRPKRQRVEHPLFDKKTVSLALTDEQGVLLKAFCATQSRLWPRLVDLACDQIRQIGACDWYKLSKQVTIWRSQEPDLEALPFEATQNTAHLVGQQFTRHLEKLFGKARGLNESERTAALESLVEAAELKVQRRVHSLHLNVKIEEKRIRLPKIGWVAYDAKPVLRALLSGEGNVRVRGCHLWRNGEGFWCATISFSRRSREKIDKSVKAARYIAEAGYLFEPEPGWWVVLDAVITEFREVGSPYAMSSAELLAGLSRNVVVAALPGRIDAKRLAKLMREAGVGAPRQVYRGGTNVFGYRRNDVIAAWGPEHRRRRPGD